MSDSAVVASKAPSPFLAQYLAAKSAHPDALLFFRMGDFYELFFEDAVAAARTLDITLTRRGQHQGEDIPMAGVPAHAADMYLSRLIRAGHKVAVCEQMEDPAEAKKRGSKSIVRREVVRVVTPGTITEEALLAARAANRLAAVASFADGWAIAWADISTGRFEVQLTRPEALEEDLAALQPAEILLTEADCARIDAKALAEVVDAALTIQPSLKADPKSAQRCLAELYEVAALDAFGAFTPPAFAAMGLLVDYVTLTQAGAAPKLSPPRAAASGRFVAIDPATRASLEIARTQRGAREGSLTHALDRTLTAAGGRLHAERLAFPLTDAAEIKRRHDSVDWLLDAPRRRAVREALKGSGDSARALHRLMLGRGGPRDLLALAHGAASGEKARSAVSSVEAPEEITRACAALDPAAQPALFAFAAEARAAILPDAPLLARDGGFIAPGIDSDLDALKALRDDSRRVIAALQARYTDETGVGMKIRHNGVLGYHIEVTPKQAEALAAHGPRFILRQTTASSVRLTTGELADLDARIARAASDLLARELALFQAFAERAAQLAEPIRAAAEALAVLDCAAAAAEWAIESDATRPEIDDGAALIVDAARHPVVEAALRREGRSFTPNDCRLDGDGSAGPRLLVVTGPNMAGKSTYLRQTALLAIMAQAGFFVPAKRLKLGVADRIFSRVGAADDLARGRSTFMMEMVETAAILHQAGPRSLVILDEIGRGTATFDGLAIAWAAAEHLHDANRCRAIFATHYHELTALAERLPAGANASLKAREWKGDLVFLHEVQTGPADRSYGIQVAKLAGMPKSAVERAKTILARLEAGKSGRAMEVAEALPLFAFAEPEAATDPVARRLAEIDPDALTPREALALLYELKALAP
jgi:DNA mismatch repair protein MutS